MLHIYICELRKSSISVQLYNKKQDTKKFSPSGDPPPGSCLKLLQKNIPQIASVRGRGVVVVIGEGGRGG